ncbi:MULTISPECIES: Asp-tRNA(Asn)/Glu-tRNA(Gln) amidotransferase subunit GatB [Pelosinus]|uniref:Aspartyl/glutamyl-tRNA(Asn/Gln) amidotransferase subunit B n=1 Tax=Pelosinus fermentans B4 TaxID=1149862 RepID=I9B3R3_9FIRM|nr:MULTISPECIES: Asp-tRNA(Asn)/Glu-tRNA(Gln) amidotransferase subunit GatB [Pelosinus]EIW19782.1 glutamyl-tRNA(Gln) amidotransferase, B subunit [Pelosinus fermentans B4]EIW21361.1 Aspartyl/glutamyl-tRNA(Asn/Gln) amidotransferase subunit B [Pelosinus fermentans A11]OAM94936.1 Aspartyl/glutamyl-tRNA(Asn/Gln) amidotransferase subunit B [Pelosinus fermentans DSM 17108]SDR20679.1 aspartyl/glutamyl-tRNA(Asn/Gln) amidotransferase subunit B [Pelosinus fermentans]
MDYEIVIGLEIHTELKTNSKIFCGCSTKFGSEQNTNVCPVCLGLPGVLPVINEKVVEFAIKAGVALNCEILPFSKFDRKNYYYPDLPKNFQTSQYDLPIAVNGHLDIEVNGETKRINITRIHMEEDAGKLVHSGATISSSDSALVDYNRTGVPLLEIVSEPDIRSAEEARAYLEKVKAILEYLDVSDCKMEEGSLRCDANISLRPHGQAALGTKAEIKNLNSFRSVQRGIEYEVIRQEDILDDGGRVIQETRTWDENKGVTASMRSKEQAHDYRYLPEPDLVPIVVDPARVAEIRANLPELPDARRQRLMNDYGLSEYDAGIITSSKAVADYFDQSVQNNGDAKVVANWLMGEVSKHLNSEGITILDCPVSPKQLTELLALIEKGTISNKIAKTVFEEMWTSRKDAEVIVKEKGLVQISDSSEIVAIVESVIAANPQSVADFKAGKDKAIGFLVGQIMKQTKGRANPDMVNTLLRERL